MNGLENVSASETQAMLRLAERLHAPGDSTCRKRLLLQGLCDLVQGVAGVCTVTRDDGPVEQKKVSTTVYRAAGAEDRVLSTCTSKVGGASADTDDWHIQCMLELPGGTAWVHIYRWPLRDPKFSSRHRELIRLFLDETTSIYHADMLFTDSDAVSLSPRESQTLECLLDGLSEKQIAMRLEISMHTVHHYVKSIHRHFNVSSRSELLARWVR